MGWRRGVAERDGGIAKWLVSNETGHRSRR
jgi:hypothetical protein